MLVDLIFTDAGYIDVMGMRLVEGRDFEDVRRLAPPEALIDRRLAERLFGNRAAAGGTIPFNDDALTVVGVVDQARLHDLHQDGRPQLYVRADDWNVRVPYFALRSDRAPDALIAEVRAAVHGIDSRIPVADVRTMDEIVGERLRERRITAALIAGFAVAALLLTAMGLYGVISGGVVRRRGEIALRLALGATHGQVLRLVVGDGARLISLGLLIGAPALYVSGQAMRGLLAGLSPFDAPTLVIIAAGLAIVGLSVSYLEAAGVSAIEPADSLKSS